MFERQVFQEREDETRDNLISFLKSNDDDPVIEEFHHEGIDINLGNFKKNEFFRSNNGLDIFQLIGSADDPATDVNMRKNFQHYENMDDEGRRLYT